MKMKQNNHKWTKSEIRASNEQAGYYYFSRKTMNFFGQTMRDFKVINRKDGRVIVYAPRKFGGLTVGEFVPETGNIKPASRELRESEGFEA